MTKLNKTTVDKFRKKMFELEANLDVLHAMIKDHILLTKNNLSNMSNKRFFLVKDTFYEMASFMLQEGRKLVDMTSNIGCEIERMEWKEHDKSKKTQHRTIPQAR